MQIEHIEDWVGREVVDRDGESVGKLEEVYFRGEEAVLAEVKPGLLARKRLLVPLSGAAVTRDDIRIDFRQADLLEERKGGQGFQAEDLTAVSEHYGAAHHFEADELESSRDRTDRLAALAEAHDRADALERDAETSAREAQAARERAEDARRDAETAERAHLAAKEKAEQARAALTHRTSGESGTTTNP